MTTTDQTNKVEQRTVKARHLKAANAAWKKAQPFCARQHSNSEVILIEAEGRDLIAQIFADFEAETLAQRDTNKSETHVDKADAWDALVAGRKREKTKRDADNGWNTALEEMLFYTEYAVIADGVVCSPCRRSLARDLAVDWRQAGSSDAVIPFSKVTAFKSILLPEQREG